MLKNPLFLEMFFLLALVGGLNYVADANHLFWSIYEFDSILHFLGGMMTSLFFAWLYFFSGAFNPFKRNLGTFLVVTVIGAMAVSVCWEIFELFLGEAFIHAGEYPYDTMMDFIMDFLGATVACFYAYIKEYNKQMIVKNSNE